MPVTRETINTSRKTLVHKYNKYGISLGLLQTEEAK